jgi:ArsR family transcriptional regulator
MSVELLNKTSDIEIASKALKAIANPLRLKILCVLANGELSVLDIVDQVGSSQSNISQHIDILRGQKILSSTRDGNRILCRVANDEVIQLIKGIQMAFCKK